MSVLLYGLTSCNSMLLSPNMMRHSNESDDIVSIEIQYKKPITIAQYQNFKLTNVFAQDPWGFGGRFTVIQEYDTVYVENQPDNFRLEYVFQDSPKVTLDSNGNMKLNADTLGKFICYDKYAIIEILPHRAFEMYKLIWLPDYSNEKLDLYTDIIDRVTIRQGLQEATYTDREELYQILGKINYFGVNFKNGKTINYILDFQRFDTIV